MIRDVEPHQRRSQQRTRRQIERPGRLSSRDAIERRRASLRRVAAQIDVLHRHGLRGPHDLLGHALGGRKDGAQDLVPCDDRGQRARERVHVQVALEPPPQVHVIARAGRLQPIEKPQLALSKRERQRTRAIDGHGIGCRGLVTSVCPRQRQARGERGDGARFEDGPDREIAAQDRMNPGDELHREQGVTADREEVVVDANPIALGPKHLHPQAVQHLLDGRSRRHHRSRVMTRRLVGRGQGTAVDLSRRRFWQRIQRDEERRHHVVGQDVRER